MVNVKRVVAAIGVTLALMLPGSAALVRHSSLGAGLAMAETRQ
jgi:hypothetical protein